MILGRFGTTAESKNHQDITSSEGPGRGIGQMIMLPVEEKEEGSKNNRMHSGEPSGVGDKTVDASSPGRPGMRILSRYSLTVNNLLKAMGVFGWHFVPPL